MAHIDENLLRTTLPKIYPDHSTVYNHIISATSVNTALKPSITPYNLNPNIQDYLILLVGTIEINYRNSNYNIPIKIWLPKEYPRVAPIPILDPTPEMQIQVSENVDANGFFRHNYLLDWNLQFNLENLINIMRNLFSIKPPVLTKPPPPIPPRLYLNHSNHNVNLNQINQINRTTHPVHTNHSNQNIHSKQVIHPQHNTNLIQANRSIQVNQNNVNQGSNINFMDRNENDLSPRIFQAPQPPTLVIQNQPNIMDLDNPIGDLHQLQLKLYQKLSLRFEKFNKENQLIREEIEIQNQKLNRNSSNINAFLINLEGLKLQCDTNIDILRNSINKLQHHTELLNSYSEVTIDHLNFDRNTLYKQLINSIAEENAIEDTYHELSMALSTNKIESKVYFKIVRSLAREQFMVRALIVKIKGKLYLP